MRLAISFEFHQRWLNRYIYRDIFSEDDENVERAEPTTFRNTRNALNTEMQKPPPPPPKDRDATMHLSRGSANRSHHAPAPSHAHNVIRMPEPIYDSGSIPHPRPHSHHEHAPNVVTMPQPEAFHGYASYRNPYETFGGPYSRQPYPEADWSQDYDFKKALKGSFDDDGKDGLAMDDPVEFEAPPAYDQRRVVPLDIGTTTSLTRMCTGSLHEHSPQREIAMEKSNNVYHEEANRRVDSHVGVDPE